MTFYHWAVKEACAGNCDQGSLEEADTFSTQLCVVMCVRIHLGSASVHNATQKEAGSSGAVMVEVVLRDDFSAGSVHRYDLH